MKKVLSLILIFMMLLFSCFTASAAQPDISLNIKKYNEASGAYETAASASDGDLLMVTVSTGGTIEKLAAVNLRLKYNSSLVSYVKNSATSLLVSDNTSAGSPIYRDNINTEDSASSNIQAYVGVDSYNNQELAAEVTGDMFTFLFTCTGASGTVEFEVTVNEIYDSTYHTIKLSNTTASASIALSSWALTAEQETAFKKLNTITYPDSKADIEAADEIYSSLTAVEKSKFKVAYPDLFTAYSKAWNTYYDLAQNAILESVLKEIEKFLEENGTVLSLTAEQVSADNYQSVLSMYKAYKNLSDQARLNMDSATVKLIEALNTAAKSVKSAVEARENADLSAKEFHESGVYSVLWGIDEEAIRNSTDSDMVSIAGMALGEYENLDLENMSEEWRKISEAHGAEIKFILEILADAVKDNEKEAAVLEEVSSFSSQWYSVLKLTAANVSVNDKTAIEMMLDAYNKLSDSAKEKLKVKKTNAEALLELISSMSDIKSSDSTGTVVVPETNTITNTVEKIVYKDAEAAEAETTVKTVVRETPLFVKIMAIIALACMLLMFVPVIIYCCTSKRFKAFLGKEEDEL